MKFFLRNFLSGSTAGLFIAVVFIFLCIMNFFLINFLSGATVGAFIAAVAQLGNSPRSLEFSVVVIFMAVLFGIFNCFLAAMNRQHDRHIAKAQQRRQGGSAAYPQARFSRVRSIHRAR